MTAIFGLVRYDDADGAADFARMSAPLRRFGPHGSSVSTDGRAHLGRHLWALLPEDDLPDLVDRGAGRRYIVVADARLSERDDLARDLGISAPESYSDSALIAAAVERWSESAFERIYGSFAILAWDKVEQRLILARDHFGLRPLLYHRNDQRVAVASMPDGLRALPDVARGADQASMQRFLRLLQPLDENTPYRDMSRVKPGYFAVAASEGLSQHRYWRPDLSPIKLSSHQHYERELGERLDAAVGSSLRGVSGKLGCHLSSGYDSTAVTATAARLLSDSPVQICAFTGVPRGEFVAPESASILSNEGPIAAKTAAMYANVQHIVVQPISALSDYLEIATSEYDTPILNMCNIAWIDAINLDAQRRGITVMLEGVMGNATISETGNIALSELLRSGRYKAWLQVAAGTIRNGNADFVRVLWRSLAPLLPTPIWKKVVSLAVRSPISVSRVSSLKADKIPIPTEELERNHNRHLLERHAYDEFGRDIQTSVQGRAMMMNVDFGVFLKSTLANRGIDVRDPTADRRLAEFTLRIPVEHFIWRGEPRALLRALLAGYVAPEMLDNQRAGNQAADWALGMPESSAQLLSEIARIEQFGPTDELLDVDRLRTLAAKWPDVVAAGLAGELEAVVDYRLAMMRGLATAAFMRKAAGSNA